MHVWVEDWSDYTINGYKVYNVSNVRSVSDFDTDLIVEKKLKVGYSLYMLNGVGMGGGTWEFGGDYVQWFRDKKLSDIMDGGGS